MNKSSVNEKKENLIIVDLIVVFILLDPHEYILVSAISCVPINSIAKSLLNIITTKNETPYWNSVDSINLPANDGVTTFVIVEGKFVGFYYNIGMNANMRTFCIFYLFERKWIEIKVICQ